MEVKVHFYETKNWNWRHLSGDFFQYLINLKIYIAQKITMYATNSNIQHVSCEVPITEKIANNIKTEFDGVIHGRGRFKAKLTAGINASFEVHIANKPPVVNVYNLDYATQNIRIQNSFSLKGETEASIRTLNITKKLNSPIAIYLDENRIMEDLEKQNYCQLQGVISTQDRYSDLTEDDILEIVKIAEYLYKNAQKYGFFIAMLSAYNSSKLSVGILSVFIKSILWIYKNITYESDYNSNQYHLKYIMCSSFVARCVLGVCVFGLKFNDISKDDMTLYNFLHLTSKLSPADLQEIIETAGIHNIPIAIQTIKF